jgi:hypothetical protein
MPTAGTSPPDAPVADRVRAALLVHPHVRAVTLVGSRASGTPVPLSDWDLEVDVDDLDLVEPDLPSLVAVLSPIAEQWDPLGPEDYRCYMLMLAGPTKVDLIFPGTPHGPSPAWEPGPETLGAIDRHFWDWILWLAAKEQAGRRTLVDEQLELLHTYLLGPMGVRTIPRSIADVTRAYLEARVRQEARFDVKVPRRLQDEVLPVLPR